MKKRIYNNPVGVSKYAGVLLVSPFIIGMIFFILYPFVCSFFLGMTSYDGIHQPEFIGMDNYKNIFNDESFRKAMKVTLKYVAILVPTKLLVSLLIALLLSIEIKGIGFFRTVFYVPSILGSNIAVIIMWQYLFTSKGMINQLIECFGVEPISWYGSPDKALFIIILLRLWEFGSTMIIFLTAIKAIPKEYYEAAKVDGCSSVKAFFLITFPQLKSAIFINLILQTIGAFQEFNAPYLITGGAPLKSTYTVGMYVYDEMFSYNEQGYANAVSCVLFMIVSAVIAIMFIVSKKMRRDAL